MRTRLRMKCKTCGHWNRIEVEKHFVEQHGSEPKVKVLIPLASRVDKTVFMNDPARISLKPIIADSH